MNPLINDDLMSILVCPVCKGDLKLIDLRGKKRLKKESDWDGKLVCKSCKLTYPIKDGIPILLPPELKS